MEFWSWLTNEKTEAADVPSPTSVHEPPGFLNVSRTKPSRREQSAGGPADATAEVLTPLEAQLKSIVVDVYSDKKKASFSGRKLGKVGTQREKFVQPKPDETFNHSLPLSPVSGLKHHSSSPSFGTFGDLVRSRPDGSEFPADSISHDRTRVASDSSPLASPEDLSAGINVLLKALQQRELDNSHFNNSSDLNSHSINKGTKKEDTVSMTSQPPMDQSLSDSQSVSSVDAFSANDMDIKSEQANLSSFQPLGQMQYSGTGTGLSASSMQRRANMAPLTDSLLYSFSDLSANNISSNKKPKLGLTDSFGIPPRLYQTAVSKPRPKALQSPRSHSTSGQYDIRIPPVGSSEVIPHSSIQTAPDVSDGMAPPLSTPPLASNQETSPPASNQDTPTPACNQVTPSSAQITPSSSSHVKPELSTPTSRAVDVSSHASNVVPYTNSVAVVPETSYHTSDVINPGRHNQPGTVVADNGGVTGHEGGVAEDKANSSLGEAIINGSQHNVVIDAPLSLEEQDAGNVSREATPTPNVPQTKYNGGSETEEKVGRRPNLEGYLVVGSNSQISAEHGSESTISDECQPSQEDGVQYLAGVDSDAAETGSVVSVQQLAEDYLSVEPADFERVAIPTEGAPLTLPAVASSPQSKPSNNPSKPVAKELPSAALRGGQIQSPSKMPPHISAFQPVERKNNLSPVVRTRSVSSDTSKPTPPVNDERSKASYGGENSSDHEKELDGQLAEERKTRIHLEGQLESLSEEYEMALGDRSDLLNKLGRSKAMLDEVTEALQREKENNIKLAALVGSTNPHVVPMSAPLHGSEDLIQQKEAHRSLQSSLVKVRQKSDKLEKELEDLGQALDQAEASKGELQDKIRHGQAELQRKSDESEERLCKLSTLEASYGALEKNKQWLHEQLQEGLKAKLALQEEVRVAKASSIAQAIRTDQVLQENAFLQQQVGDLQKGVLLDKEKLVSQLEEIEAGVLSREDFCSNLVAEKSQLENMVKLKGEMVSKLNSDLGRAQVEKEELREQVAQASNEKTELARKTGDLEKESKSLSKKLKDLAHSLEMKENECDELERARSSLQERLRQAEVECVSRNGIIQTLNEAKDMLQHELDLVVESKEGIENELGDTKCEVARLEADVRAALDKCSEKEMLLQSTVEASEGGQKEMMQALLGAKDKEIREKEAAVKSLEEQVGDLVKEFATLQSDFHAQSGSVSDSIAEKDRVISHLSSLKEQSEQELESLQEENDKFQERISHLQHEKARLQGQVEGSVQPGDYQKALQDKTEMQATLNAENLKHQQSQLKSQAKVNRLEREHRESQKTASTLQNDMKTAQDGVKEDLDKMKGDHSRLLAKLKETEEKLRMAQVEREIPRELQDSSRHSGDYVAALRSKCDELRRENQALAHSLEEELDQKREVERASGLVASQLKQNFEKEKKGIQEKNREQSFDVERLQGKLVGLRTTQATLREHTANLETSLAEKEAAVVRLSGKVQRLVEEKETDGQQLKARIAALEGQVKEKQEEVTDCRMEFDEEKNKGEKLEQEVERLEAELAAKKATLSRLSVEDAPRLKEQVTSLSLEKETLQSDLSYLKSQLLIAKTSADSARREITDKVSQIEILQRQLAIAESRYQQANDDAKRLKEHMRTSDRLQAAGILEGLKAGGRSDGFAVESGSRRRKRRDGSDQPFDTSLSSISGTEEVDQSSLNQSGSKSDSGQVNSEKPEVLIHHSPGSRLEQARMTADPIQYGEVPTLQERSRTLGSLQACITDLRSDMRKLNLQVNQNTATVKESQKYSKQADSQIEQIRQSSSFPYAHQSQQISLRDNVKFPATTEHRHYGFAQTYCCSKYRS